jgi:N-acetylmuramoyl-L-alanine amidase
MKLCRYAVAILLALTIPASAEDAHSANFILPGCKGILDRENMPPPLPSGGCYEYSPIFLYQRLNYRTATSCNPQEFRIAIDVGHTIEAPGALSARGVPEYTFNISLAERLVKALKHAGFDHTYLLTMRGIGKPQLIQRSVRANTLQVDLFVSVHHDDVQQKYYGSWQYNGKTLHFSDKFSGYSLFMSYMNAYPARSLRFAQLVGTEFMARGMHFTTHHAENISGERRQLIDPERGVYQYDQLIVLKHTKAPSVLIEAGVIVNRAEEVLLASPERQELFSKAVLAAVNQFCGSQE